MVRSHGEETVVNDVTRKERWLGRLKQRLSLRKKAQPEPSMGVAFTPTQPVPAGPTNRAARRAMGAHARGAKRELLPRWAYSSRPRDVARRDARVG